MVHGWFGGEILDKIVKLLIEDPHLTSHHRTIVSLQSIEFAWCNRPLQQWISNLIFQKKCIFITTKPLIVYGIEVPLKLRNTSITNSHFGLDINNRDHYMYNPAHNLYWPHTT